VWGFVLFRYGAIHKHVDRHRPIVPRERAGSGGCIPTTDVLVEQRVFEHNRHLRHIGHVPIVERLVERVYAAALVGAFRGVTVEHTCHVRDVVDPPFVQRLVERIGLIEHRLHIRDAGHIPFTDVLVKVRAVVALEHVGHIPYARHIPITHGLVVVWARGEHVLHRRAA
tara:strand:- start:466 stop:972 length:507 start_codon:yes stop_codon:yes gene_type:complete